MTRTRRAWRAAAMVLGALLLSPVARADVDETALPVEIPFVRFKLDNGLTVILAEDHRVPLVAVDVWYGVGPADEPPGRSGFAHLFEHLMFGGSAHVGADRHAALLEQAGATHWNGVTDFDHTRYFETLPKNRLALALWLEADRLGFLRVTQAALDRERETVRNERRQTDESTPYARSSDAMVQALFPPGHPYHGNVIGSHADLAAATLDDVRAFYCAFYRPSRATLIIAGDFEPAAARAMVERYFGTLPAAPCSDDRRSSVPRATPAATTTPDVATTPRRLVVREAVALARVAIGFVTPPAFAPDDAALDLAANVLGEGRSSRLYRRLVYERKLASSVHCQHESLRLASMFTCEAVAALGVPTATLEQALAAEIVAVGGEEVAPAELARARNGLSAEVIVQLQRLGGVGGKSEVLGYYDFYRDDPGYLARDLARYRALDPASVRAAVRRRLDPATAVTVVTEPDSTSSSTTVDEVAPPPASAPAHAVSLTSRASATQRPTTPTGTDPKQAFRAHAPAPSIAAATPLPTVTRLTRSNGLDVWILERHDLPYVVMRAVVRAGDGAQAEDAPGHDGLAAFTAELLQSGSRGLDGKERGALEVADAFAEQGAILDVGTGRESADVTVGALKPTLPRVLSLFTDVLTRPRFADADVERVRDETLAAVASASRDPALAVTDVMGAAVFGPRHPYGTLHLGTPESLRALCGDDVRAFYRAHYQPRGTALVFVGDVTPAEVERLLAETGLDAWSVPDVAPRQDADPATTTPPPRANSSDAAISGGLVLVHPPASSSRDDAPSRTAATSRTAESGDSESQIGFALSVVPRRHADYVPLLVAATCLGGSDSSRLFARLRDQRRYTYGLYATLTPHRRASLLWAAGGVRRNATFAALGELRAELARLVTHPPTASEVALARTQLVHQIADQLETMEDAVTLLAQLAALDLAPDELSHLVAALDAVTPAAVARALRAHVDPRRATFFVAFAPAGGDAGSDSPARALRSLPLLHRDSFGRPAPTETRPGADGK